MIHSLTYDLASSLKQEEIVAFKLFLHSDYFSKEFNVMELETLFDMLQKAISDGDLERLDKEHLYPLVFPAKPVIRNKLEKLASDLNKNIRQFLLIRRYFREENDLNQQLDWLKELRERGLANRHQHVFEKVKKDVQQDFVKSLLHYQHLQLIAQEEYEWQNVFNNVKGDMRLSELVGHVDNYYYAYRTDLVNRLLLHQRRATVESKVLVLLEQPWSPPAVILENSDLLQISWAIYQLLRDENPSTTEVQKLHELILSKEETLGSEEIRDFYTYLRSICAILIDHGDTEFLPELHKLQKDNLKRGYFYFEGKIIPQSCINITQTAIKVGAIDWVKQFLETHKDKILGDGKDKEYYRLNLAICLFAEKKYDEALGVILFDNSLSQYHIMARRLELQIYYELRSDLLPYKIDAFSMFIRRAGQKVYSKDLQELYLNFVNALRQIYLSTDVSDPTRSERLTKRINAKKMIAERKWLLEKAAELGRNNKKTPR